MAEGIGSRRHTAKAQLPYKMATGWNNVTVESSINQNSFDLTWSRHSERTDNAVADARFKQSPAGGASLASVYRELEPRREARHLVAFAFSVSAGGGGDSGGGGNPMRYAYIYKLHGVKRRR